MLSCEIAVEELFKIIKAIHLLFPRKIKKEFEGPGVTIATMGRCGESGEGLVGPSAAISLFMAKRRKIKKEEAEKLAYLGVSFCRIRATH